MSGKVFLIGAGPGAADLITVRGARLLREADVVFHDALVQADLLALAPQARKVAVGKRCGRHSTAQRFINKMLIDAARRHRCVVRLKGGDPMLFGRAQEEIDALRAAGIDVEVVPGVTAALAASAMLQTSLTLRGVARSVAFVTPRVGAEEQPGTWTPAAAAADTCVLYMAAGQAGQIAEALLAAGRPAATPLVIVENVSLPQARQWCMTLGELARFDSSQLAGPATIVLGEIVAERAAVAKTDRQANAG